MNAAELALTVGYAALGLVLLVLIAVRPQPPRGDNP